MTTRLPDALRYFINAIRSPLCALVESFEDLQDGRVMLEMVRVIAGGGEGAVTTPNATPPQRIRAGLLFLAEKDGWDSLPEVLRRWDATEKFAQPDSGVAQIFVEYLQQKQQQGLSRGSSVTVTPAVMPDSTDHPSSPSPTPLPSSLPSTASLDVAENKLSALNSDTKENTDKNSDPSIQSDDASQKLQQQQQQQQQQPQKRRPRLQKVRAKVRIIGTTLPGKIKEEKEEMPPRERYPPPAYVLDRSAEANEKSAASTRGGGSSAYLLTEKEKESAVAAMAAAASSFSVPASTPLLRPPPLQHQTANASSAAKVSPLQEERGHGSTPLLMAASAKMGDTDKLDAYARGYAAAMVAHYGDATQALDQSDTHSASGAADSSGREEKQKKSRRRPRRSSKAENNSGGEEGCSGSSPALLHPRFTTSSNTPPPAYAPSSAAAGTGQGGGRVPRNNRVGRGKRWKPPGWNASVSTLTQKDGPPPPPPPPPGSPPPHSTTGTSSRDEETSERQAFNVVQAEGDRAGVQLGSMWDPTYTPSATPGGSNPVGYMTAKEQAAANVEESRQRAAGRHPSSSSSSTDDENLQTSGGSREAVSWEPHGSNKRVSFEKGNSSRRHGGHPGSSGGRGEEQYGGSPERNNPRGASYGLEKQSSAHRLSPASRAYACASRDMRLVEQQAKLEVRRRRLQGRVDDLLFELMTQVVTWMRCLGVHVDPSHVPARGCTASPADLNDTQSRAVVDALPPPDLSNPLFNGVALSELAAAISSKRPTAESRTEVLLATQKSSSRGKGPDAAGKGGAKQFVLRGTALTVRTMAQAVQNINLAVNELKARREMAPSRHWHHPASIINWKSLAIAAAQGRTAAAPTGQQMDYVVSPAGCDSTAKGAEDSATGDQLLVDEMLEQQMGSLWGLLADVYDSFAPLLVTPVARGVCEAPPPLIVRASQQLESGENGHGGCGGDNDRIPGIEESLGGAAPGREGLYPGSGNENYMEAQRLSVAAQKELERARRRVSHGVASSQEKAMVARFATDSDGEAVAKKKVGALQDVAPPRTRSPDSRQQQHRGRRGNVGGTPHVRLSRSKSRSASPEKSRQPQRRQYDEYGFPIPLSSSADLSPRKQKQKQQQHHHHDRSSSGTSTSRQGKDIYHPMRQPDDGPMRGGRNATDHRQHPLRVSDGDVTVARRRSKAKRARAWAPPPLSDPCWRQHERNRVFANIMSQTGSGKSSNGSSSCGSSSVGSTNGDSQSAEDIEAKYPPLMPVTSQQESAVRAWLHRLGFAVPRRDWDYHLNSGSAKSPGDAGAATLAFGGVLGGSASAMAAVSMVPMDTSNHRRALEAKGSGPLKDPIRNGVLLGDLLILLEPQVCAHAQLSELLWRPPQTIDDAVENVTRTLWLLRLRCSPPLPMRYLCDAAGILAHDRPLVWGLLWHLMQAYPSVEELERGGVVTGSADGMDGGGGGGILGRSDEASVGQPLGFGAATAAARSGVVRRLPYTRELRRKLQSSLVQWMHELGVLSEYDTNSLPPDLYDLEARLRDGTLLCELTECITATSVRGWLAKPRTRMTCLANINKACQVLRGWRPMSWRYLGQGVEENLYHSDWVTILGLLEDMHRAADGLPPRPALGAASTAKNHTSLQPHPDTGGAPMDLPYLGGYSRAAIPVVPEWHAHHQQSTLGAAVSGSAEDDSTQPALHVPPEASDLQVIHSSDAVAWIHRNHTTLQASHERIAALNMYHGQPTIQDVRTNDDRGASLLHEGFNLNTGEENAMEAMPLTAIEAALANLGREDGGSSPDHRRAKLMDGGVGGPSQRNRGGGANSFALNDDADLVPQQMSYARDASEEHYQRPPVTESNTRGAATSVAPDRGNVPAPFSWPSEGATQRTATRSSSGGAPSSPPHCKRHPLTLQSMDIFARLDRHHHGSVSQSDMILSLREAPEIAALLGLSSTIHQEDGSRDAMMRLFHLIDVDDDKHITRTEWERAIREKIVRLSDSTGLRNGDNVAAVPTSSTKNRGSGGDRSEGSFGSNVHPRADGKIRQTSVEDITPGQRDDAKIRDGGSVQVTEEIVPLEQGTVSPNRQEAATALTQLHGTHDISDARAKAAPVERSEAVQTKESLAVEVMHSHPSRHGLEDLSGYLQAAGDSEVSSTPSMNSSNVIDKEALAKAVASSLMSTQRSSHAMRALFDSADEDNDGRVNRRQLLFALRRQPQLCSALNLPSAMRLDDGQWVDMLERALSVTTGGSAGGAPQRSYSFVDFVSVMGQVMGVATAAISTSRSSSSMDQLPVHQQQKVEGKEGKVPVSGRSRGRGEVRDMDIGGSTGRSRSRRTNSKERQLGTEKGALWVGSGPNGLASTKEVASIEQWLRHRLGVVLDDPLALATAYAGEWCDGRRIARIVCRLEGHGAHAESSAPGLARLAAYSATSTEAAERVVDQQAHGAAGDGSGGGGKRARCLHAIKLALRTVAARRNNFPVRFQNVAEDVLHGDTRVIVPLLLALRRAYGHDKHATQPHQRK